MFSSLKKIIFPRPKQRQLFSYWDGYQNVYADPIQVSDKLDSHPVYRSDLHPRLAESDNQAGREAWQVCMEAWRTAFNLQPFDPISGKGLTDAEVNALHGVYYLYIDQLKKSTNETLTQLGCSVATLNQFEPATQKDTLDASLTLSGKLGEKSIKSGEASNTESKPKLEVGHHP